MVQMQLSYGAIYVKNEQYDPGKQGGRDLFEVQNGCR